MKKLPCKLYVSDAAGEVSAEIFYPDTKLTAVFVLAHGAGAGMNHPFMISLGLELATYPIAILRFNFPFTEHKKKRPDFPAVAHQTIVAAIRKAHETFPEIPVFAGGKSFGGRMSSQLMATNPQARVKGLVFVGFPLHPPGKPSTDRADHLQHVKVPMLFLQGTRDELATWVLVEEVTKKLPLATLIKVEGADHSFKAGKQNLIPMMAEKIFHWIEQT